MLWPKLTLTVQKEMQIASARAGMTPDQLRAVLSEPLVMAGGLPVRVPSPEVMSSSDEDQVAYPDKTRLIR
jgi:hypothetical protein